MNAERLTEIKRDLERGGDADRWPPAAIHELVVEVERLSHLHDLDHSLADQWQADNERLREGLAKLEWSGSTCYGSPQEPEWCCPACYAIKNQPHKTDCWLAKELLREVVE